MDRGPCRAEVYVELLDELGVSFRLADEFLLGFFRLFIRPLDELLLLADLRLCPRLPFVSLAVVSFNRFSSGSVS